MNRKAIVDKMFEACTEQKIYDFKDKFMAVFTEEFNKCCNKVAKEVSRELARFDVVEESVSIPLSTPDVKSAELFAVESDDENMVVKFKLDDSEDEMEYKIPEENADFYKALEEDGLDSLDDEMKEKLSADLSEFVIDMNKKAKSVKESSGGDMFRIEGVDKNGKDYKSNWTNDKGKLNSIKKELEAIGYKQLSIRKTLDTKTKEVADD